MKRLSILFILLLCSFAQAADNIQLARMNPYVAGSVVAAVSCSTSNDSLIYDGSGGSNMGNSLWYAMATQFTITGTKTITEYIITINNYSESGTETASLYTDNAGSVGTIIEGTSKQITISSNGVKTFTLDTPKTLAAGTYWLHVTNPMGRWGHAEHDGGGRVWADGSYYEYHMLSQVMGCD